MKAIRRALCAATLFALSAIPGHAEEKVIHMGTLSWEDLTPITGVTRKVLEDKGYKVEVTEFSEWGIAYAALAKGDIELLASQVDYAAQDYWDRNKRRLEKVSPVSHGLYQAIAVPRYVDINSIDELNANAERFGNRIVGIEPGSGLMQDAQKAVEDYGLKTQLVEGSTAAMTAALKAATDRKDWIAVTVWQPSWMMARYDLKFLADSKGVFPPAQSYYWVAQKGFSEAKPEAREAVASVFLPLEDITAINVAVANGATMDAAVADWLSAHAELVSRWENNKAE